MCGLVGILFWPAERSATEWDTIRRCFTQAMLCNEERGREAAGVALVRSDGTFRLFKQPVSASELSVMAGYKDLLSGLDAKTTCLLGHTRAPTKGSRWDNANNHPLLAGRVIGIHNGHIRNDDELFAELALPRDGQVDSEIIFRLLDTVSPSGRNGGYLAAVRECIRRLDGPFSTLSVDLARPNRLLVLKKDQPLCVHYHQPWQALCFSSRYLFLRKTFGRAVIMEILPAKQLYLFDAQQIPQHGNEPIGVLSMSGDGAFGPSPLDLAAGSDGLAEIR